LFENHGHTAPTFPPLGAADPTPLDDAVQLAVLEPAKEMMLRGRFEPLSGIFA
jgi:hypothetical protein